MRQMKVTTGVTSGETSLGGSFSKMSSVRFCPDLPENANTVSSFPQIGAETGCLWEIFRGNALWGLNSIRESVAPKDSSGRERPSGKTQAMHLLTEMLSKPRWYTF